MGCTTSKQARKHAIRRGWSAPFARSLSMPTRRRAQKERDSYHLVSLTSTSYGVLNTNRPGHQAEEDGGSFINVAGKMQDLMGNTDHSSMYWSDVKQFVASMKLKSVTEEDDIGLAKYGELETINTWELMEGLEDAGRSPSPMRLADSPLKAFESGRHNLVDRSLSFHSLQDVDYSLAKMVSPNYSVWRKYLRDEGFAKEMDAPLLQNTTLYTSYRSVSPTSRLQKARPETDALSLLESVDGQTGLRMLLSPTANVSHSITSSTKTTSPVKRSGTSFDGDVEHLYNGFSPLSDGSFAKSPLRSPGLLSPGGMATPDGLRGHGSPLFDPAILATFENALKAASESYCQSEYASTPSSDFILSPSETSLHADRPHLKTVDVESSEKHSYGGNQTSRENRLLEVKGNAIQLRVDGSYPKKMSNSKILPINFDENTLNRPSSLGSFEAKCPPGGEAKVVLYITSLRGIRKTYEDCCNVRMILQGLGVDVDERDTWMHSKFRHELTNVLGRALPLPRLFIKGRHIGGAEDVRLLHEDGILANLLEGLTTDVIRKACDGCGDMRFVPCFTCSGSCKLINEVTYGFTRCPDCNENGLIMCPVCRH